MRSLPKGKPMRNPRPFPSMLVPLATAVLATLSLVACNQSQPPTAPTATESKAAATAAATKDVYVIFEGPWAIVPDPKDANNVLALAPKTKNHHDLFVQAWDKTLSSGIYNFSLPARSGPAAGTIDPNILQTKIDPQNVQHVLDNKSERYAIRLPKPDAYVAHTHYRSRAGSAYPPDASTEKDYVTVVSLRYSVTPLNGFSLAGASDNGVFNPLLLQVETPIINFVINPAHELDPADKCNTHSRESFRDLTKLLNVTLFVDFPNDPAACHGKDPQNIPAKAEIHHLTAWKQLAALLVHGSAGSLKQQLLVALYFFGGQSGDCRSPIIVGG